MRLLVLLLFAIASIDSKFTNKQVSIQVDLTSQLVKCRTTVVATALETSPSYKLAFQSHVIPKIAFLTVSVDEAPAIVYDKLTKDENGGFVNVPVDVVKGEDVKLVIEQVLSRQYQILPEFIAQTDSQYVRFKSNLKFYSPYPTLNQRIDFSLSSSDILEISPQPHSKPDVHSVSYSFPSDSAPFSVMEFVVHLENNSPFLTAASVSRCVEVSMFGDIGIRNHLIDLVHTGAKLSSGFSRAIHMLRGFRSRISTGDFAVGELEMRVPAKAKHLYYRDHLGNISTSEMRSSHKEILLDLKPRFPLFGGWTTSYTVGYSMSRNLLLKRKGNEYLLRVRVVDHLFNDQHIDRLQLKIALPYLSKVESIKTPFKMNREQDQITFGYFDIIGGKPTVVLTKSNVVNSHSKYIEVLFTLPVYASIVQPAIVSLIFFGIFLTIITARRLGTCLRPNCREKCSKKDD